MTWFRRRLVVLWAAIALLAGADSVGVALVAVHRAPAPALIAGGTTTTTLADASTTTSTIAAAPTDTSLLTTATTRRGGSATTAPASASGVTPPKAGTYRYHVTSHTTGVDAGDDEYDEDLNIVDLGGGRQRHRSLSDGELDNVDEIAWRADGRYVAVSMDEDQPQPSDCNWEPDLRTLAFPAVTGTTWTFKSSCTIRDPDEPEPFTFTFAGTGHIVGTEKATVGTATVDVVKIHVDVAPDEGDDSTTFSIDEVFAPAYGLTIEETQRESGVEPDENDNDVPYTDVETRRLESVSPG